MRRGACGKAQVLLQLVERPGAAVVIAGPLQPVALEGVAGVLAGGLGQAPLGAPLRDPDLHSRAPHPAEPGGVEILGSGNLGYEHRLRVSEWVLIEIDPLQHTAHQLRPGQILGSINDEAALAHDASLAHEEHRHGGLQLIGGHAEDVEVLRLRTHHLLALDGLAHAHQVVAEAGRPLEVQSLGSGGHVGREAARDLVGVAAQEVQELRDKFAVARLVDLVHARARAALDVV